MKKRIALSLIFTILIAFAAILPTITPTPAAAAPIATLDACSADRLSPMVSTYVGATTTGKFHYVDCRWGQRIRDDHRVYFDSREDAINNGYIPCKVCRP